MVMPSTAAVATGASSVAGAVSSPATRSPSSSRPSVNFTVCY
jgi:hypothetical protein